MNLSDASILLGENSRYFTEVYKNFSFKDEQTLKDYLDFIAHEPVEWLRGFPSKLKTKNTFSRPKTILIKLLKMPEIQTSLGAEYVENIRNAVWPAYKNHIDSIIAQRNRTHTANVIEQLGESIDNSDAEMIVETDDAPAPAPAPFVGDGPGNNSDTEFVPQQVPCNSCLRWETKFNICKSAMNALIAQHAYTCPGLANATSILLEALYHS